MKYCSFEKMCSKFDGSCTRSAEYNCKIAKKHNTCPLLPKSYKDRSCNALFLKKLLKRGQSCLEDGNCRFLQKPELAYLISTSDQKPPSEKQIAEVSHLI